jgi:hypothetical protein
VRDGRTFTRTTSLVDGLELFVEVASFDPYVNNRRKFQMIVLESIAVSFGAVLMLYVLPIPTIHTVTKNCVVGLTNTLMKSLH